MKPLECGEAMRGCREMIAAWSIGRKGMCQNRDAGCLIGANKGIKYAVMQVHSIFFIIKTIRTPPIY